MLRGRGIFFIISSFLASAGCSGSVDRKDSGHDAVRQQDERVSSDSVTKPDASGLDSKVQMSPKVLIQTSMGGIAIELDEKRAPISVKNFLSYVDSKFYDGTIFHRVIIDFMIQGGGFDTSYKAKPTQAPIRNEAGNQLRNDRGTVAMARTQVVDSATSQFFINVVDNSSLNHTDETPQGFGYAVFGKVIQGMEVVDKIKAVPTGAKAPFAKDCPLTDVVILAVKRTE